MTVRTLVIAANSEDGMYSSQTSAWDSTQLAQGSAGGFDKYLGLRYSGVNIPQGALITSATVTLKSGGSFFGGTGTKWGNLYGDAVDNASSWSTGSAPNAITKTTATAVMAYSMTQDDLVSQDVTAIIQEIVNRAGWASGNALRIGGDPLAGAGSDGQAIWKDLDSFAHNSPLNINFITGPLGGSSGRGAMLGHGFGNVDMFNLLMNDGEDNSNAMSNAMTRFFFDNPVQVGAQRRSELYKGAQTDDGLISLGRRDLFKWD